MLALMQDTARPSPRPRPALRPPLWRCQTLLRTLPGPPRLGRPRTAARPHFRWEALAAGSPAPHSPSHLMLCLELQ